MMNMTPQERLALGVVALLVAAGVGARMLDRGPAPAELTASAQEDSGSLASLRADVGRRTAEAARRARPLAPGEKIDPNTAPAEELDRLPKVGAGQARKIVEWRETHHPFRTLADLDSVPGIGAAALAALAPYVALPSADVLPPPIVAARPESAPAIRRSAGDFAAPVPGASRVISLTSASAQELTGLPGIGPSLAGRIVAWRQGHGAFRSLDELEQVSGIGPAKVARIRSSGAAIP